MAIGVVIGAEKLGSQKMDIRKADFELRPILKIISPETILNEKQITFALWMSEYYYCAIGPIIKTMLPAKNQISKIKTQNSGEKPKNKQTLILTPEISLIQKLAGQYKTEDITIIHSNLTDKQYLENWHKIRDNEVKIIIGARLALFAPFVNLTEIIIEDEHNDLYKSRQTPRYHARETAIKLAELWNAEITFKSRTPSIEAFWLAEKKKITLDKSATSQQPLVR
jgi:primosomal protein N'